MYPKAKIIENRSLAVNREYGLKNSKFYQPSEINEFRTVELPEGVKKFRSDVSLLMHQQVLDENLSKSEIEKFISRLQSQNQSIDTSKFTDDQLMTCIKGKHIQSPSELLAWSNYLQSQMDNEIKKMTKKEIDKLNAKARKDYFENLNKETKSEE